MELELRIFFVEAREKIFVPLDIEVGMESTLHEDTRAAERDRLIDALADLIE